MTTVNVASVHQPPLPSVAPEAPLPENPLEQQPENKAKRKKRSKLTGAEDSNSTTIIPTPSSPARENTVPIQATATPEHTASTPSSQLPLHSTAPYNAATPSLHPLHHMPPPGDPHYGLVPLSHYYYPYHAYATPTYYPNTGQNGHGIPSAASGNHTPPLPGFQLPHPQCMTPYPYPYQYSYPHPYPYPYPCPPGQSIPAYQYNQLQWDMVMTPPTTPAYGRIETHITIPGPSTQPDQTGSARKRKRKDLALATDGGSTRVEELPSSPKALTIKAARDPSPKKQVVGQTLFVSRISRLMIVHSFHVRISHASVLLL
jgi:hypothetical protein